MSHDITTDPPRALDVIHITSPFAKPAATTAVPAAPAAGTGTAPRAPRKKTGRPPKPKQPPPEQAASPQARRTATILLEVLAGQRSTTDAARALDVSSVRFYAIEARAVAGFITACEPRPTGIQPEVRDAHDLERQRELVRRQGMELQQLRSVLRSTQRQLGVVAPPPDPKKKADADGKGKPKRKPRRPTVRALTVVRRLIAADAAISSSPSATPSPPAAVAGG